MAVRPACYIPDPREHGDALRARRNAGAFVEALALSLFLAAVTLWSAIASGLL